jgi:hypothetical protein
VLFVLILFGRGQFGGNVDRTEADQHVAAVGERVAAIPYRIGDWAGRDVTLPAAALEILHSSAAVSRSYSNLRTGDQARLAIIFCGDVRDMLGHHPPACYPASGWRQSGGENGRKGESRLTIRIHGEEVEANIFRFFKADPSGVDRQITIVGFFALPGVGMTPDPAVVRSRSTRRAVSSLGAGQVQVLLDGFPSEKRAVELAEDLLGAIPASTFEVLKGNRADEESTRSSQERQISEADFGTTSAEHIGMGSENQGGPAGGEP